MILTLNPSRRPSRAVFWCVLGLGTLLLPFAPGAARTEAPKEGERAKEPEQAPRVQFGTKELVDSPVKSGAKGLADHTQYCSSCHQPQTVHERELHQKPQSWQEAHRQAVYLMDQYTRLLRESERGFTPAAERTRGDEIEELQDEIDLLRLQVRLKESRLRSAQSAAALARKQRERGEKLVKNGIADDIDKLVSEAEVVTAEAEGKAVELEEAKLRLKQAERRLARLQRPAEGIEKGRTEQEKRLRELEQKVESLLKEIREMRRERQPDKPRVPGESSKNPPDDRLWKEVGLRLRSVGGGILAGKAEFRGGMFVEAIRGAGPAQFSGLRVGDILVGLDKSEILSNENVQYVLKQTAEDGSKSLKFYYLRGKELHNGKFEFGE